MEITVNNQLFQVNEESTLSTLLSTIVHIPESGIAIAVNQLVVSKSQWSIHLLQSGDQVVLIKATQGG